MKLKSGRTYWPAVNPDLGRYATLRQDVACDVAIVGGGIIGALLAYHLSDQGLSIVLVDKRPMGQGSTSASTALLLYELDVHLTELSRAIGAKRAAQVYAHSLQSIGTLYRLTKKLGIGDCYRRKKSLYVGFQKRDVAALKREHQMRRRHGIQCDFLDGTTLAGRFGLDAHAAILSHAAAEVDPYRLTRVLLQRAKERGVRCFERVQVAAISESRQGTVLATQDHTIRARWVVMATGYESQQYIKQKVVDLKSSFVVVSEPLPRLPEHWLHDHLLWETARPYLYVRTTPDDRIIVGGEDEPAVSDGRRDALVEAKSLKLVARFGALFPTLAFDPAFAWAGTFGETKDGMGYVGVPAGWRHTQFVLGFGGNGITFAVTAAEIVAAKVLRRRCSVAQLFSFKR